MRKTGEEGIDEAGFRANVGIVLTNSAADVFWAERIRGSGWQFPQGGIENGETPQESMYEELYEEVGLRPDQVSLLGQTKEWLYYHIPSRLRRPGSSCIGQKQIWFLLRLLGDEHAINLCRSPTPEFSSWRWVAYWYPPQQVVSFKRHVYRQALRQLEPLLRIGSEG